MRKKIYRAVAVATIIACAAMAFLSWYAIGVIAKSNTEDMLECRVNQIVEAIDKWQLEYDSINERIYSEYKSKARALALLFSQNPEIMYEETKFEEIRVITGAEVICITNSNDEIEFTTGSANGEQKIYKEFFSAKTDTVFSEVILDTEFEKPKVIAGCSRLDEIGIIQIEFSPENIESILELSDLSKMFNDIPIMQNGCIALINKETMNYISHTNESMTGKPSGFSLENDFNSFDDDPNFNCGINGEEVMLQYADTPKGIVIGYVPYCEIYETRDDTIKWVIAAAMVISIVVTLTVRNKILRINKKKNN